MGSDQSIIDACQKAGVDADRLERCLNGRDNWGKMVHAFEYLTVCEAVLHAMKQAKRDAGGE